MTDVHAKPCARREVCGSLAAILIPLTVYAITMAPTVYGLDSAELTAGAYSLGIVHSPGAPTYMLLGHLFSKIPIGDVGFRLNLLSAVFGAATVFVVYRINRELKFSIPSALIAAWLLAFSFYFWAWALVAELYAPHAFFASICYLCLLKWRQTHSRRALLTGAILLGLGLGNHTALVLLIPGYAWLVFSARPSILWQARLMAATIFCGLLGLSIYFYFPIRQSAHPQIDYVSEYFPDISLRSLSGLFWMVRGGMFKALYFSQPPAVLPAEGLHFLHVLVSNFTPLGVGLAVVGCLVLYKRDFSVCISLVMLFVMHSTFFLTYGALDRFWMLSVSYVVVAIWSAAGVEYAERRLREWIPKLPDRLATGSAAACILLLLLVNWSKLDLSRDTSARDFGLLLGSKMKHDAEFFGLWEQMPILEYLQVVEGWREDIRLHNTVFLDSGRVLEILTKGHAQGRPIYASRPDLVPIPGAVFEAIITNNLYEVLVVSNSKERGRL